jgi:hypothetical protein
MLLEKHIDNIAMVCFANKLSDDSLAVHVVLPAVDID